MTCQKCKTQTTQPKINQCGHDPKTMWVVWTCRGCGMHLQSMYVPKYNIAKHVMHYGKQ